jgi:hypothetical protein
VQLPR